VARNVRLNMRRAAGRQLAVAERLGAEASVADPDGSGAADVVEAGLATLPERDRELLLLAVWDELDRSAIAAVVGCSKTNVSVRLHRARRRFAAAVAELGARDAHAPSSLIAGGADVPS
jgi:RNA polymerase sigma-70 factor (ECF subfamily)